MLLQALGDNVIVKPVYDEKVKGIIIPEIALKFKKYDGQVYGEVHSVGPKVTLRFAREPIKPGDKLIWVRHEGKRVEYEGQEYFKVASKWILGMWID